jgi:Uma2 family endonuclease
MYARAGIREYWIVDLTNARRLVYREPRDGVYRSNEAFTREQRVAPIAFSELSIAVADILG